MKIRNDFVTNSSSSSFIIVPDSDKNIQYLTPDHSVFGFESFDDFLKSYIEYEVDEYFDDERLTALNELAGLSLTEDQYKLVAYLTFEPYEAQDLLEVKHLMEQGKHAYYAGYVDNNSIEYQRFRSMGDEVVLERDH